MFHRNRLVNRISAATLAISFLVGTGLSASAGAESERAADGAVVVRALGQVNDFIGAGTIVAVGGSSVTVLTAKHVATAGTGELSIRFGDGTKAAAHLSSVVRDRDLALIMADVDAAYAATLHVAAVGAPKSNQPVHVWGSGTSGPAFEPAAVNTVGAALPDGSVRERYSVNCALCHEGDSGAGVFDAHGTLVGVFIGYFETSTGHLGVAEQPLDAAALAAAGVPAATVAHVSVPAVTLPNIASESTTVVAATFANAR